MADEEEELERKSAVKVIDPDSGSDAWVLTRVTPDGVGLALSIEDNGDLEAFLPPEAALKVASALSEAARAIESKS